MANEQAVSCLILPDDAPPSATSIKRQLLFFDAVVLPNLDDRALVNDGEVREKFPVGEFVWAARNNFPRQPGYDDAIRQIWADTAGLRGRGLIRATASFKNIGVDPGTNWMLWAAAIASRDLVELASPDRTPERRPRNDYLAGYMNGLIVLNNGKSKYAVPGCGPAYMVPDVPEDWSLLGHLRIGRAIKFLRYAQGTNLCPISLDPINDSLVGWINGAAEAKQREAGNVGASLAVSFDLFEPAALDTALADMSWKEVSKLRKATLPGAVALRNLLVSNVAKIRQKNLPDVDSYRNELQVLAREFAERKEQLAEEWDKLGFVAITKGGYGAWMGGSAASAYASTIASATWVQIATTIASLGVGAAVGLAPEIAALLPARRKVREHPLFFAERLGKKLEK